MENLILIGGGGHAKSCIDIIRSTAQYNILGYIDLTPCLDDKFGIPYLGNDEVIPDYIQGNQFLICIGHTQSSEIRKKMYQHLKNLGAKLATIVSPHAHISSYASIGEGSIIFHGVSIQADAHIGVNCIINNHALIEHESRIGDHSHISTGSIVNGNVQIGQGVFVGSGAVLKQGIEVGSSALIGMGSIVLNHVAANQVVFGNPAKSR